MIASLLTVPPKDGITQILVRNDSGFTQKLDEGAVLRVVGSAEVLDIYPDMETTDSVTVNKLDSANQGLRKEKFLATLRLPTLPPDKLQQLKDFLVDHPDVFTWRKVSLGKLMLYNLRQTIGMPLLKSNLLGECVLLSDRR